VEETIATEGVAEKREKGEREKDRIASDERKKGKY
jgi:hypothetical protein